MVKTESSPLALSTTLSSSTLERHQSQPLLGTQLDRILKRNEEKSSKGATSTSKLRRETTFIVKKEKSPETISELKIREKSNLVINYKKIDIRQIEREHCFVH